MNTTHHHIVADENMPAVAELFAPLATVQQLPGRNLRGQDLAKASVLLVRSVTPVNEHLLANSHIQFVGSATIGTDHIDLDYLQRRGIGFAHAPACNAEAVVDYVLATLCSVASDGESRSWLDKTIAVVGCGNVGGRLVGRLKQLGVNCLGYDPFKADSCDFEAIFGADILCLHTPLTRNGAYPSHHLFNNEVLSRLKPNTLIINAGRGGVIDNQALLQHIQQGHVRAVLDVWEDEPHINPQLLAVVEQGTPHIAGYSLEGRLRGTLMLYEAFCQWQGLATSKSLKSLLACYAAPVGDQESGSSGADDRANVQLHISQQQGFDQQALYQQIRHLVTSAYNPKQDHQRLLAAAKGNDLATEFDSLRKNYPLRREFAYCSMPAVQGVALNSALKAIGFD